MADKQNDLKLIRMNEVEAIEIRWLWYPYIPFGKITVIQGDPGDGKTTAVLADRRKSEISIYVHPSAASKGIGNLLLQFLINISEEQGFWTLEAKVFSENQASFHLHKKNGFRIVGIREKIGKRDGIWRDNILLERRSTLVGNEGP
ncbi:GNAT family N-acetyltransferase [Paenibacillus thiaminolyticus]|uniref:GNAT family N-acetyltransferase n=1 Tax=Paenibacillus thiaminolyticus TaxID=49283 RepID=UPI001161E6BF|nr:GNAT family N-acetyltransferase [Paenibacillus thiaminolyticus]NGP58330.1 GNAT family N-acetyltransferase [Paenibacillus thiaminolyticus]